MPTLFTEPLFAHLTGEHPNRNNRYELTPADLDAVSALPRRNIARFVVVTDQQTGRRYAARRASCGLHCFCAIALTPITEEN